MAALALPVVAVEGAHAPGQPAGHLSPLRTRCAGANRGVCARNPQCADADSLVESSLGAPYRLSASSGGARECSKRGFSGLGRIFKLLCCHKTPPRPSASTPPRAPLSDAPLSASDLDFFDCFLAHNWGLDSQGRDNHERVGALCKQLKSFGITCWLDQDYINGPDGDINYQMTTGIDASTTFLAFVTEKYVLKVCGYGERGDDDNCRMEFNYALLRKGVKSILAIVMEPEMSDTSKWMGVVGAKLGHNLYIDLSCDIGTQGWFDGVEQLKRAIQLRQDMLFLREESSRITSRSSIRNPLNSVARVLANVPLEVQTLPSTTLQRPELLAKLKDQVLKPNAGRISLTAPPKWHTGQAGANVSRKTLTTGMGGVGKTTIATALVRDEEIRSYFDKICWVSVGQQPDIQSLQSILYRQLVNRPLDEAAKSDELIAFGVLVETASSMSVLLVLDDVWDTKHLIVLNFLDSASTHSSLLVTTRMRNLVDNAVEMQCDTLTTSESLRLLLRAGGCENRLTSPPPAAFEAVKLCGQLPLTLGIAGGIIAELADNWEEHLIPVLRSLKDDRATFEERVVEATFAAVPEGMRSHLEHLFALFAVFPEEAVIPAAMVDVLGRLIDGDRKAKISLRVRRSLMQMLKMNILLGSIDRGVSMHDLIRDCALVRAQRLSEGGIRAVQRELVPLMLDAVDESVPVARYMAHKFHWHVRQGVQPDVSLRNDSVLMRCFTHSNPTVMHQSTLGVGIECVHSVADECEANGDFFCGAQLMNAAMMCRGASAGRARRAWVFFEKERERAGDRGLDDAHLALEGRVLSALTIMPLTGFAVGSKEHAAVLHRVQEIGTIVSLDDHKGVGIMYALLCTYIVASMGVVYREGIAGYPGPMNAEALSWVCGQYQEQHKIMLDAAASAPTEALGVAVLQYVVAHTMMCNRHHAAPEFDPEVCCGVRGERLKEQLNRYDYEVHHPLAKQICFQVDPKAWGLEMLALLLFWGDLQGMRAGYAKTLTLHKHFLTNVRNGSDTATGVAYEIYNSLTGVFGALLAAGDLATMRSFMANSLFGELFVNEAVQKDVSLFWAGGFAEWKAESGHYHSSWHSWFTLVRGFAELIKDDDTLVSHEALRTWIPGKEELIQLTERELSWRGHCYGLTHPALLFAMLYGERLEEWGVTIELCNAVLEIEEFQPFLRTEACRLLGLAHANLGEHQAACEAAERAFAEAAKGQYRWLQVRSLHDMLQWCEPAHSAELALRLAAAEGRLCASEVELRQLLPLPVEVRL